MKSLFLALLMTQALALSAFAGTEVHYFTPYYDSFALLKSEGASQFNIVGVRLVKAPTKVETADVDCSIPDEINCTETRVLESVPAVEVKVEYYKPTSFSDDSAWLTEDLTLDPAKLPASISQALAGNKILRGKKAAALFALQTKGFNEDVNVIDEQKSDICTSEYPCENHLVYKTVNVEKVLISVNAR